MGRTLFASSSLRNLNLLVLATLIAVGAFQAGRAGAARRSERRRTGVVDAVRHAAPAVVSVFAEMRSRRGYRKRTAGAGVIVHPAGYVVTNAHVIEGGSSVWVELFNGGGRHRAQVKTILRGNDLALLRIQRAKPFPYVSIAESRDAVLGESVIAVGNPHGLGDTVTVGVVSALGRDAKLSNGVALRNLLQTDASINTGNSGGALLNLDGELLGVIVSLLPQSTGIAFAIPGDQVRSMLQRALGSAPASNPLPDREVPPPTRPQPGRVSSLREQATRGAPSAGGLPPPSVGSPGRTSAIKTSPMHVSDYGLRVRDTGAWLQVTVVNRNSAAALAGMQVGDVLLAIDGRPVENDLDLVLAFSAAYPARVYEIELRRGSVEKHASLLTPK